ncbi:MAG: WD40 repeat domain-containing protein [Alphaproteobacteria bacterium]|nr:WD40 repeat domain-containing protein [Alphaproteobacteria bacterium]
MSRKYITAFTLLELSIVIVIIAVITAMGVVSTQGITEAAKRAATENKMDVIEKALMDFRTVNGRLPCPADITIANGGANYGEEATTANPYSLSDDYCIYARLGTIPVKALGLPDEYMVDGWGNRFTYNMQGYRSTAILNTVRLDTIYPVSDSIMVNDAAGAARSSAVLYTLISHGPNGYEAYTTSGTQNPLSTNGEEQATAFRSAGPPVQKDATSVFDDIVRYKEHWQMQTEEDARSWSTYRGPQMVAAGRANGNMWLYGYDVMLNGSWLRTQEIITPDSLATTEIKSILFTPNNRHLFIYSDNTTRCRLYAITGKTFTYLSSAVPNCPATYSTNDAVAMSDNGYLAISSGSTVYLSKMGNAGSSFVELSPATLSTGWSVKDISFSHNGDFLLLADRSTNVKIYKRNADGLGFSLLSSQPSYSAGTFFSATLSPDGRYVALITPTTPAIIHCWRRDDDNSFTTLSTINAGSAKNWMSLNFSMDGKYLAAVAVNPSGYKLYKIDAGDVFTPITVATQHNTNVPIKFIFDRYNQHAAALDPNDGTIIFFARTGADSFELHEQLWEDMVPYAIAFPH